MTKHKKTEIEPRESVADELIEAIHARWPKSVIQFEDFQFKWAFETLEKYRMKFCMFNDDIQGTAGVALAGLLGTARAQGLPLSEFVNQKIVVVGAGSTGLGVLKMAYESVARMSGTTPNPQFFLIDKGLITKERSGVDSAAAPFAKAIGEVESIGLREGSDLLEVVIQQMVILVCKSSEVVIQQMVILVYYKEKRAE